MHRLQDTPSGAASSMVLAEEGGAASSIEEASAGGPIDHVSPVTPPDEVAREGREELLTKLPPSPLLDVQQLQRRRGWTINIILFDFPCPFKRFSTTSAEKRVEHKDIPFRFGRGRGELEVGRGGVCGFSLGHTITSVSATCPQVVSDEAALAEMADAERVVPLRPWDVARPFAGLQ